ncbi:hypothetical protein HPB52_000596 [Rhipicephalus sanguineus]|uniref:Uncharacterized protein n=1 Tax=Rhipicephalus sanguineus TaxID=34632 RepID=A0A9D4QBD2_RHISA|nr:hypothetical protein HPB52_000596 [Rhipicephalus sanguineus]
MQNRFATTDGDAFRLFIHYRLKGGQTIKDYYDEKKRLGSLADLKECHIISGLTDGVPPDVELALAGLSFTSSSEWLAAAQRFHWHNECPRRGNVSAIETRPGNEESDPEFH